MRTAGSSSWPARAARPSGPIVSSAVAASSARRGSESSSSAAARWDRSGLAELAERDDAGAAQRERLGLGGVAHEDADVLTATEPADGRGARLADGEVGVGVEQLPAARAAPG